MVRVAPDTPAPLDAESGDTQGLIVGSITSFLVLKRQLLCQTLCHINVWLEEKSAHVGLMVQ